MIPCFTALIRVKIDAEMTLAWTTNAWFWNLEIQLEEKIWQNLKMTIWNDARREKIMTIQ